MALLLLRGCHKLKIQFLNGGLANQTFQYIFARYYELSHPGEIMLLDDSYFALYTVHNGYELGKVFGLKPHFLSECFDDDVWEEILKEKKNGKSIPELMNEFDVNMYMIADTEPDGFNPFSGEIRYMNRYEPRILDEPGNIYYHGYWIRKEWFERFKNQFLKELTFSEITDERNCEYEKQILSEKSLAIHVRRGDFINVGISLETTFYAENILEFATKYGRDWTLYVFSDDLNWCKEKCRDMLFHVFDKIVYVEGNEREQSFRDLQLMSLCEGMIISNSSFCYLAALLNTRKKCVVNRMKNRRL